MGKEKHPVVIKTRVRLPCLWRAAFGGFWFAKGRGFKGERGRAPSTVSRRMETGGDSAMIRVG